ncbi:hypothetical protein FA95DRAFT_690291 [Auriscalpium vulgare]|uniref:Uncharacterized protein n=1 Tax=Auriscalpium vulgare TaxID=40419 RepID=A0ACB8RD48_9AGAM|nr:hypothetical protein FA95DRAFT_690291 [Auriscalpium vulgare]
MPAADSDSHDAVVQQCHADPEPSIERIPPEILSKIFTILTTIDQPAKNRSQITCRRKPLGWLSVTHVCQRWRNAALEDPILWAANILVPCPLGNRWAAAFFARSKTAPLVINRDQSRLLTVTPFELAYVGENLAHTRFLRINMTGYALPSLCQPAPILQSLNITNSSGREDGLPADLLGGVSGAPALQHLRLQGFPPWSSPFLEKLVSLDTSDCGMRLVDLLARLKPLQSLEELVLRLGRAGGVADWDNVVELASLRKLHLCGTTMAARRFLDHLALPADLSVHCEVPWEEAWTITELIPLVRRCTGGQAISHICIAGNTWSDLQKKRNLEVAALLSGNAEPTVTLAIDRAPGNTSHRPHIIPYVFKAMVSKHLEQLSMHSDLFISDWVDALRGASRLSRVTLQGQSLRDFCTALDRSEDLLPALAVLTIHSVDFSPEDSSQCNTVDGILSRTFAARARAGHALDELHVVECRVPYWKLLAVQMELPETKVWSRECYDA